MGELTAVVVGGGIAGLASAIALAQAGWRVTVLERAPEFGEVGAGLGVTGNGMTALAALGLDEAVRAVGYQTAVAGYQDPGGRWLMRFPATKVTTIQLMRHDVYHLPQGPRSYVSGRVVLVGDAAHAALPTSGQGAASALEDGVCVGRMIAAPVRDGGDLAPQLAAFDRARRPRCQRIVRTGIMVARFGADLGGGWRQTVRNTLMRVAPPGPLIKVGAPIVRWTPP